MAWVPLMRARPSLATSSTVGIPARSMATSPGRTSPSYSAWPRPSMGSTMWDRGARSPLAPREPFWGMTGVTPRFSMATRVSTSSRRVPEKPLARLLTRRSMMPRATSRGKGSPAPTAWVTIRFLWSCLHSSWVMVTSLNFPKPVVIPYTTAASSTSISTTWRDSKMRCLASGARATGALSRQTAASSSKVSVWPVIRIFSMLQPPC